MRTKVSKRGQTTIPAELRQRYSIAERTALEWLDTGTSLKVIPVPSDPVALLRGCGSGEQLVERLYRTTREAYRAGPL